MKRSWFCNVRARSWSDVLHLHSYLGDGYLFRGQASSGWGLASTFERAWAGWRNVDALRVIGAEQTILNRLRQLAPNYSSRLPASDKPLDWLALLQHHGGSTRLLDASRSFYVAAFFACDDSAQDGAIWCFHRRRLVRTAFAFKFPVHYEKAYADFIDAEAPTFDEHEFAQELLDVSLRGARQFRAVIPVAPNFVNERMAIQQGEFIAAVDVASSIEESLESMFMREQWLKRDPEVIDYATEQQAWKSFWHRVREAAVVKLEIPSDSKYEALRELDQMNITTATLFPGFDGFARSLQSLTRDSLYSADETRRVFRSYFGEDQPPAIKN